MLYVIIWIAESKKWRRSRTQNIKHYISTFTHRVDLVADDKEWTEIPRFVHWSPKGFLDYFSDSSHFYIELSASNLCLHWYHIWMCAPRQLCIFMNGYARRRVVGALYNPFYSEWLIFRGFFFLFRLHKPGVGYSRDIYHFQSYLLLYLYVLYFVAVGCKNFLLAIVP